jgi:uncharacterized protein with HEPN domain
LEHILAAIGQIESFTAGYNSDTFQSDQKTVRAVERCLEIISEASRDIPADLKSAHPAINWRAMADAGNLYRHGYEYVSTVTVWETVRLHLPPLKVLCLQLQQTKA